MHELRHALRRLRRAPGFAAASILTLALGIAAATTIFSVVYGVLLRPLPYRDADRIVLVEAWQDYSGREVRANYALADLPYWRDRTRSFESISLVYTDAQPLTTKSGSDVVSVDIVTPGFFDVLRGRFALGRAFESADAASPVAVISYRLWQRAFGGASDVLGRALTLNGQTYTIIGVAEDAFRAFDPEAAAYLTSGYAQIIRPEDFGPGIRRGGFNPIGRLKPGVTRAQAQADADTVTRALAADAPANRRRPRAAILGLRDRITGDVRPALLVLFAAVGLVLIIACANVANLLLSRHASHAREIAIRRALGASRGQLARRSLAESAAISAIGCAVGTISAAWMTTALVRLDATALPRLDAIHVDRPVLLFAAAAAALSALAVGLLPALQAPAIGMLTVSAPHAGGRRTRRVRTTLIVAELAISLVLLVGAALFGRSLMRLLHTDVGVPTDHVAAALIDLSFGRRIDESAQRQLADRILARVSVLPGVVHAGAGTSVPPNRSRARFTMRRDNARGRPADYLVDAVAATPRFFSTLGVPLVRGRFFTDADDGLHPQVAIMTARTARELLGNADPIGRTIDLPSTHGGVTATVVGIVGDIKYSGLGADAGGAVYRPFAQQPWTSLFVLARTAGDPGPVAARLGRTIAAVDPGIAIYSTSTLDGFIAESVAQPRLRTVLLIALAGLAMTLAAVGLYGVVAYAVAQRTAEIGIRMALGADRRDVIRLVLREGAWMAAGGLALGIGAALALARALAAMLYGVDPDDPVSFAIAAACLVMVVLAASYLPARRAARVDPIAALRAE